MFKTVDDFVNTYVEDASKRRPIKKVCSVNAFYSSAFFLLSCVFVQMLVATNGIAAVRCILSIRKLLMQLFRNDRIIKFICLTTEQEIRSNAGESAHLELADFQCLWRTLVSFGYIQRCTSSSYVKGIAMFETFGVRCLSV